MSEHVRVDPITCEAHGLCAELLPERIRLDDWGYPIIDDRPIPHALLDHARRAVAACPVVALRLQHAPDTPDRRRAPSSSVPPPGRRSS
jgi:ferredoxin